MRLEAIRGFLTGRFFAVLAAGFFCVASHATTLPSIAMEELFREADIVALVQVRTGETLESFGKPCGAKYKAVVVDGFKGAATGSTIEFGYHYGSAIGSQYLVFLSKPGRVHEPEMTSNGRQLEAKGEHRRLCPHAFLANTVMHSGYGKMEIGFVGDFKYEDGVAVPTRYVRLPGKLPSVPVKFSEGNRYSAEVWVRVPDLTAALRKMGK